MQSAVSQELTKIRAIIDSIGCPYERIVVLYWYIQSLKDLAKEFNEVDVAERILREPPSKV